MKKLFTLFAVVMMAIGAWADNTTTYSPTAEYNVRPKADGSGWTTSPTAGAASAKATFEFKASACFYAIQQYKITDLALANSITLQLTDGTGSDALAIWAFKGTFASDMTATDFNTAFKNTTGVEAGASGTHSTTYLLKDIATSKNPSKFTISGTALTTLKSLAAEDGTITLLITNKTTDLDAASSTANRKYLSSNSSNAETSRPILTVTTPSVSVYNVTTQTSYENLTKAVEAAAENDEIKLMDNQTLTARLNIDKVLTIDGNSKTITINQTSTSGFLITAGATVKNVTVTGADGGKAVFELGGDKATSTFAANIEGVTVNNANVGSNGVYRIVKNAQVTLKNVVNSGCTVTDGYAEIFLGSAAQTTACKLAETNTIASVYFEKGKRLYVYGATISSPISLTFASAYTIPTACVIQGCADVTKFTVTNDGLEMYVSKTGTGANNELGVQEKVTTKDVTPKENCQNYVTFYDKDNAWSVDRTKARIYVAEQPATGASTIKLNYVDDDVTTINAGKPVILRNLDETATSITLTKTTDANTTAYEGNALKAAEAAGTVANAYVMGYYSTTSEFGFFPYTAEMAAGQVYVTVPAGAKKLTVTFDDDATAVNAVSEANTQSTKTVKMVQNGQLVIKTVNGTFNAAGARVK